MDTPKIDAGRDYEALIGIAMDMGTYAVTGSLPPLGRIFFDLGVRARNDVYRHELADAARGRRPGVCRGFHRADVAANHHRHVASTDVFLADQHNAGRLHHRVG
jgi:hypothetical protein